MSYETCPAQRTKVKQQQSCSIPLFYKGSNAILHTVSKGHYIRSITQTFPTKSTLRLDQEKGGYFFFAVCQKTSYITVK
jgi:hypothetical protein